MFRFYLFSKEQPNAADTVLRLSDNRTNRKWVSVLITLYIYKVPLRDVVGLKSRGCRKLKRGSIIIRRPYLPRRVVLCTVLQDEVRRRVFDFQLVRENVIMIACIYRIFR